MKKQIVTGLIGAASLLAMAASGAYAIGDTCASGTITKVMPGYNEATWHLGCTGTIYMRCGTETVDKAYCTFDYFKGDAVMAVALTAVVEGKSVSYNTYPGYGDGLILSLTLLNPNP